MRSSTPGSLHGPPRVAPCAEGVPAGRQSRVSRLPPVAGYFVPFLIQPLQLVSIAVRRRIGIAERREGDREDILLVRENQTAGVRDGLLKGGMTPNLYRIPRQPEVGENNSRSVRSVHNLIRVEAGGPAEPAEVHLSTWTFEARAPACQIRPWQSVRGRVVRHCLSLRIESRHTIVGAHPEIAGVIFEDAAHCVTREAIPLRVDGERARLRV